MLEGANIKLSGTVSDINGKSARSILIKRYPSFVYRPTGSYCRNVILQNFIKITIEPLAMMPGAFASHMLIFG